MQKAEDGVLLAILPTGTGKTEIALALAKTARQQTTVIVIPTITLAHDFERRFREVYETDEPFAWVGTTTDDDRTKLQDRFVTGQQPILVITPDSLEQRLRDTIKNAAGAGRLRALVIDEAHRLEDAATSMLRRQLSTRSRFWNRLFGRYPFE